MLPPAVAKFTRGTASASSLPVATSKMCAAASSDPFSESAAATYLPPKEGTKKSIDSDPLPLAALGSKMTRALAGSSAERITTSVGCCWGGWYFSANNIPARNCRPKYDAEPAGNKLFEAIFNGSAGGQVIEIFASARVLGGAPLLNRRVVPGFQPTVVVGDRDAIIFVGDGPLGSVGRLRDGRGLGEGEDGEKTKRQNERREFFHRHGRPLGQARELYKGAVSPCGG